MRKSNFWGMRNRLIASFIGVLLLPLLIISIFLDITIEAQTREDFINATTREVIQVDNAINLFFQGIKENTKMLAMDSATRRASSKITTYMDKKGGADGMIPMTPLETGGFEGDLFKQFGEFIKTHPEVSTISIGTSDGGFMQWPAIPRKVGYDSRSRDWYKDSMAAPDKIILADPFLTSKGVPTIGIFTTVKDESQVLRGVLGFNIDLPVITDMIKNIKIGKTGYVILVDKNGTIIADPKKPELSFKKISEMNVTKLNDITNMTNTNFEITVDGIEHVANVYSSPSTGWKYVILVEKSELLESLSKVRKVMMMVAFISILLVLCVAFYISNHFSRPLIAAVEYIGELGTGNFTISPSTSFRDRTDELGSLFRAIAGMQSDIKNLLRQVQEVAQGVGQNSNTMKNTTQKTSHSISEVSLSLGQIATVSVAQATDMELGMERMNELADQVKTVEAYTSDMADAYKDMCVLNNTVAEIVNVLTKKMAEGQESSQEVDRVVKEVNQMTGQIGSITGTIEQIAAQTNLLALNASIEAARAGEHGRGFAVVADEVRKLAEQSASAANHIKLLISDVQQHSSIAVNAISKAKQVVLEQEETVTTVWSLFEKMSCSTTQLNEKVAEMYTRFGVMSRKSNEVTNLFSNISAGSEETSAITEEVHVLTDKQMTDIGEVTDCVNELHRMVNQLQENLSKFKI